MNTKVKVALQKLVNKLEMIEKDEYVKNFHKYVFSLWKSEMKEAKEALEQSNKPPVNLCTGYTTSREIDLFDVNQLEQIKKENCENYPLKDENEL